MTPASALTEVDAAGGAVARVLRGLVVLAFVILVLAAAIAVADGSEGRSGAAEAFGEDFWGGVFIQTLFLGPGALIYLVALEWVSRRRDLDQFTALLLSPLLFATVLPILVLNPPELHEALVVLVVAFTYGFLVYRSRVPSGLRWSTARLALIAGGLYVVALGLATEPGQELLRAL